MLSSLKLNLISRLKFFFLILDIIYSFNLTKLFLYFLIQLVTVCLYKLSNEAFLL